MQLVSNFDKKHKVLIKTCDFVTDTLRKQYRVTYGIAYRVNCIEGSVGSYALSICG